MKVINVGKGLSVLQLISRYRKMFLHVAINDSLKTNKAKLAKTLICLVLSVTVTLNMESL